MIQSLKRKQELNARQWELYSYLKEQDEYKLAVEIMHDTGLYGDIPEANINNCKGIRTLKKDVYTIRKANVIQTTILSSTVKGYKIATKKEYKEYSERKWKAINKIINLQSIQDRKAGLDGQTRLVFGYEKPVIEAFR